MQGFQITFFTQQGRRHGHQPLHEWLAQQAREVGVRGSTTVLAAAGDDHTGRHHAAHFFELADQPVELTLAMTAEQAAQLFQRLEQAQANVFYVKTVVEFGTVGAPEAGGGA